MEPREKKLPPVTTAGMSADDRNLLQGRKTDREITSLGVTTHQLGKPRKRRLT